MKRIAVIDCGTNTFNLLIAEIGVKGEWRKIHGMSIPVKLSPKGEKNTIDPIRIARAVDALTVYKNNIVNYSVDETFAFATAAFRTSENGEQLRKLVLEKTGIDIQIIDGDQEAQYIYEGVKLLNIIGDEKVLIMDIGGGSTEFIIADANELIWKRSYPLGVSKIHNQFSISDIISDQQLNSIDEYMEEICTDLYEMLNKHKPQILVGTAGSFNSIVNMIFGDEFLKDHKETANKIPMEKYHHLSKEVLASTLNERLMMVGLQAYRAPIFPVAIAEINIILRKTGILKMIQSPFALKEGALGQLIREK